MSIRVDTMKYEASHGHKPATKQAGAWAFQLDTNPEPMIVRSRYLAALRIAKIYAKYSVTVLP